MAFDYRAEYRRGFGGWQTLLGVQARGEYAEVLEPALAGRLGSVDVSGVLVRGVAGEDKPAGIGLKLTAATRFRLYALSPVFCARE